ncbi:rab-GTPase-TBC domain-containing protein [Umbelopsis sp. AD052]|nr:rab-GTPase-TBC domain-containing protein [Umbelopsis sp. AD052]
MKADTTAHKKSTSSTPSSPASSVELSTDAEVNKQQPEAANSDTDTAHVSATMDDQSSDTNPDSVSIHSQNSVASDSDSDFESAVEDGREKTRTSTSVRSSTDIVGDTRSSLSSLCEPLNESDDGLSAETNTSISCSSPTEPYKMGSNMEYGNDDDRVEDDLSLNDRARKTASVPVFRMESPRVSLEGISLPSDTRKQRLQEEGKKSRGFAKRFSFPINPFARSASPATPETIPPQRPSEVLQHRFSQLSKDKKKARESITSIVSLRDMLAQTGKSSEEQHTIVIQELDKLKHEIEVEKDEEPNWDFWASVLVDYEHISKSNGKQLSQHIRLGIPFSLRGMMWQLFSGSKDDALEEQYRELLNETSTHEKLIQRDLARTFPGHDYFKERGGDGQEGLFNVVKAYSLYDPEVGYCQGLAFVVGPLLLNMPDEEAFCVLVQLMGKYGLRGHFTPQMEQLHRRLYQFEQLLLEKLPRIHRYLNEQGIQSTMYASQWFMTLFAYKFPLELVFRIFDIILAEGIDSIFQFALAVLKSNEKVILSLEFEALLDFLKNGLFAEYQNDDRRLVHDACAISINPRKLKQYGRQHDTLIVKEQQMNEREEALRQSNREMMETIKRLEISLQKLQEEHEHVAAQVITSKVELAQLDSNNSELRKTNAELRRQIDALPAEIESRWKTEFDDLCKQNSDLAQKNSALEDSLMTQEGVVIDLKMRYAECENEKEAFQCQLNELKKII